MHADTRRPRRIAAQDDVRDAMVDLLVRHIDRAYVTAGQPGMLEAVRDLLRTMDRRALTSMIYEVGLEAEPPAEDEGER